MTGGTVVGRPDALRLIAFMLSVIALFFLARDGQSQPVMYAAFAAFLITATLWVRGLDATWVSGTGEDQGWGLFAAAVALPLLATLAIGLWVERTWSTLVIGVAIAVYLALGLLIRRMRWRVIDSRALPWRGIWQGKVLAAVVVIAYIGLWMLGRTPLPLAGLVLAAAALVPAFVHVKSEQRILEMTHPAADEDRSGRWIVAGGLATVAGLLGGLATMGHGRYLILILVAVAFLSWALTVGSLADIAVVLGALALMGVTPASQDVEPAILSAQAAPGESVVVSIGDSYSSGEGAERYLDDTNIGGKNQCRRAATAWPVLVAEAVDADRLVFRACSGARARNLVGDAPGDEQYAGEGIQLATARTELAGATPALVLLSIGGNDSGFRQVGSSCLSLDRCDKDAVAHLFYDNLAAVQAALRATYLEVATTFPHSPIAVMPYPDAFARQARAGCPRAPVESGDISFVRRFTGRLDARIARLARETGLYYVAPMRTALTASSLGLCDESGTPGLNFLDLRGVGGVAGRRFNPGNWIHNSLHPNERGHAALAAAFAGWLNSQNRTDGEAQLTGLAALLPPAEKRAYDNLGDPEANGPVLTRDDWSLCFDRNGTCGDEADQWALGRIAPTSPVPLFLMALVAVGAWALAIGISARRVTRVHQPQSRVAPVTGAAH